LKKILDEILRKGLTENPFCIFFKYAELLVLHIKS